jgi:hypothetical protein
LFFLKEDTMKKILLAACFIFVSSQAFADEATLVSGESAHGGFGGPVFKVSMLNGETAFFTGGRGGWLIDHVVFIGGGGYGQTVDIKAPAGAVAYFAEEANNSELKLSIEYGGLYLGYINDWEKLLHYSFNALIGSGKVSYRDTGWKGYREDHFYRQDEIFVFEPGIDVELNITKRLRFTAGVSYLYVGGLKLYGLNESEISGPGASCMIKFGAF